MSTKQSKSSRPWTSTQFHSLEQALDIARQLGMNPTPIEVKQDLSGSTIRYFKTMRGLVVAQRGEGGPVLQREPSPSAKMKRATSRSQRRSRNRKRRTSKPGGYDPRMNLRASPWFAVPNYNTLEDVTQHYLNDFRIGEFVVFPCVLARANDGSEYEAYQDAQGVVHLRTLYKPLYGDHKGHEVFVEYKQFEKRQRQKVNKGVKQLRLPEC